MAIKKTAPKKKAPARAKKARPLPPVQTAAPEPAPKDSGTLIVKVILTTVSLFVLLIVVVVLNHRHEEPAQAVAIPAASPAPTAVPDKPLLPPIQAEGPKLAPPAPAHREAASADVKPATQPRPKPAPQAETASGGDDERRITADRPLKIRAWRKAGQTASLDVFGAHNKLIAHLESDAGPAGWQTLAWDGQDAQGQAAEPGTVYVRASAPGLQDIIRVHIR
jgi:hypothetical protein